MLSRKVIAMNVTNLTDARYFAARGIDYLLFDLDEMDVSHILEIKEWVEGPEILLLFSAQSINDVDECVLKIKPVAIGGKTKEIEQNLSYLSGYTGLLEFQNNQLSFNGQIYCRVATKDELATIDERTGLLISGSIEDQVGIKSFDQLDEVLDQLEL